MKEFQKHFAKLLAINGYLPKILLAAFIGFVTGLVAVAFHYGLEFCSRAVREPWSGENGLPWWSFAAMPSLGGFLVGLIIFKLAQAPETAG